MGNLRSVSKAFEHLGVENSITHDPSVIESAGAVVLPGVGAFGDACDGLREKGLFDVTKARAEEARDGGRPFLGICLGMQIIVTESEESPGAEGFGVIPGKCTLMKREKLKVPQMGWNQLIQKQPNCPIYQNISVDLYVYFVHSFEVKPNDSAAISATTDFGGEVVASLGVGNLFATQFHPEKSQKVGLQMLTNFSKLADLLPVG